MRQTDSSRYVALSRADANPGAGADSEINFKCPGDLYGNSSF